MGKAAQQPAEQPAASEGESKQESGAENQTAANAATTGVENAPADANGNAEQAQSEQSTGGVAPDIVGPVDEEAPYGRRADGTPAAKRGPKSAGTIDERNKQRARLKSVSPSTARVKPPLASATVTPLAVVNYQAMGEQAANLFFGIGTMTLGADWEPDDEGEKLAVAHGFRDYFKAIDMRDLPPGFALTVVLGVYTIKRAERPTVKTKFQAFGAFVKKFTLKRPAVFGG